MDEAGWEKVGQEIKRKAGVASVAVTSPLSAAAKDQCPKCYGYAWNGYSCKQCGYEVQKPESLPSQPTVTVPVPLPPEPKPKGSCPQCKWDYAWDGSKCNHCGYGGGKRKKKKKKRETTVEPVRNSAGGAGSVVCKIIGALVCLFAIYLFLFVNIIVGIVVFFVGQAIQSAGQQEESHGSNAGWVILGLVILYFVFLRG